MYRYQIVSVIALGLLACALVSCHEGKESGGAAMKREKAGEAGRQVVRDPAVAGQFYPGSESELRREVKGYLDKVASEKIEGKIVGLISPHAGYTYSGQTAAYGYKLLEGKGIKRVIVVAPSHHVGFRGAALPAADAYKTPLGIIPIDRESCQMLSKNEIYSGSPAAHEDEHSLEVQLPFLQEVLKDFTLIPIIIGQTSEEDNKSIAAPLRKLLDEKTIIVASSDFTHYGYSFGYVPFRDNIKENLKNLDLGAVQQIEKMDAEGFNSYVERTGATICGHCPIGILLEALPRNAHGTLLKYETSGDLTGDYSHCVSYVSMVFTVR
ncbi:MAG: AmmeMemoRadiSam system protein B [Candidatus Aureabacteria bacterium]|nr:AmmeMemoRadiSam system protein B [Candidatus Auribacterota bacterium]